MSDKKVTFRDTVQMENQVESSGRFKGKHSLDSDEESDGEPDENYVLNEDDIEGQEDATIDHEGEVKITPFNLKEEMEEGHFDSAGNYFVKKDKEIRDEWLEAVDWQKIDERAVKIAQQEEEDKFEDAPDEIDQVKNIKAILEIIKPGETVLKALKRLGGAQQKQSSASMKWKAKKQKVASEEKPTTVAKNEDNSADKELLLKLTGLADELLQEGMFSIYQDTFEKMSYQVKQMEKEKEDQNEDDALEAAFQQGTSTVSSEEKKDGTPLNETLWHYKWKIADDAEVFGPFNSTQMLEWTTEGFFGDGVWVRKTGQSGEFHNSKRIDFDLYI